MVICRLCGKKFKKLGKHLSGRAHNKIGVDAYKEMFPDAPTIDPEFSNQVRKQLVNQWANDKFKSSRSKAIKEGQQSSEKFHQMVQDVLVNQSTEQRSKNAKKRNANPEFKAKMSKRTTEQLKKQWADPEWKEKQSKKVKQGHINKILNEPDYLEMLKKTMAEKAKKTWADPVIRKRQRERISRENTERMLAGTNTWVLHRTNRLKCKYDGPKGQITMRSTWEVTLAEDLDSLNVKWEYEPTQFAYDYDGATLSYTPDFYLSDYDRYIEVGVSRFKDDPKEAAKLAAVSNLLLLTELNYPFITPVNENSLEGLLLT